MQKPFEIEMDTSEYAMGVIFLQGERPIYYHSKKLSGVVLNYPKYYKELYALVQAMNKWKHYLLGKDTITHTNHKPLQYLQT